MKKNSINFTLSDNIHVPLQLRYESWLYGRGEACYGTHFGVEYRCV